MIVLEWNDVDISESASLFGSFWMVLRNSSYSTSKGEDFVSSAEVSKVPVNRPGSTSSN